MLTLKVNLEDIVISENFQKRSPSREKIEECRSWWKKFKEQKKLIIVDMDGVLIDGYTQYLALKEEMVKRAIVNTYGNKDKTYIFGKHFDTESGRWSKEYVWSLPPEWVCTGKGKNIKKDDRVLVQTRHGVETAFVTRVLKLDVPPVDGEIRHIIKEIPVVNYKESVIDYDIELAKMLGYIN
jgi:hypothetical protein